MQARVARTLVHVQLAAVPTPTVRTIASELVGRNVCSELVSADTTIATRIRRALVYVLVACRSSPPGVARTLKQLVE